MEMIENKKTPLLPLWAWILIGVAAAGGVCLLVGFLIGKKRRQQQQQVQ
jgi:hypothetical protein